MKNIYLYYSDSMSFFGKRACKLFGWTRFYPVDCKRKDLPKDTVVIFWLYDQQAYYIFQQTKYPKRVYWHGFDVYFTMNAENRKILHDTPAIHACQSEQQAYILNLAGIDAKIRPYFFGLISKYKPMEQSLTIEDIYINVNHGREEEYGLLHFLRAAKELPGKRFHVFGITEFIELPNVLYYGRVDEDKYDDIVKDFDLYCCLHRNAGTSQSAVKAMLHGQRILSINELSFVDAHQVSNWKDVCEFISLPKNPVYSTLPELLNNEDWI
jgi:hypothetical protein